MKIKGIVSGHSKGLGAGITQALLNRQIPVLGLSRSAMAVTSGLEQVEIDLSDTSALHDWLACDDLANFVDQADCVVLINNAGLVGPVAPAQRQSGHEVAQSVALNITAPLVLTAALAKRPMPLQKRVVHISSGAGRSAYPGWSVYCATKAALDHHARATVLDADPTLKLVSLAPGVIDTSMQTEIRATSTEDFPNVDRFHALKRDGLLVSPESAGEAVVEYVLSNRFGSEVVDDLRS